MIPKECKRLAEVDFPIAVVSKHAAREKSIRHGHPSTLHLWWARRPLAACRAMLLGLLLPDPCDPACPAEFKDAARNALDGVQRDGDASDEELRRALLKFIGDFANWDLASNARYLDASRALVRAAHGKEPPLVVDPFAGGGSIPLEALRLGCDAFASDLNPVACLILKVMLEDTPRHAPAFAEELRRVGREIRDAAEHELAEFYPADADGSTPIAYLWARTVRCESAGCGAEIPLVRSWWLSRKARRRRAIRPIVIRTEQPPRVVFKVVEPANDKEVPAGSTKGGKATCLACNVVLPADRVRAQLSRCSGGADVVFDEHGRRVGGACLTALVVLRAGESGRHYRPAVAEDYLPVQRAMERLREVTATSIDGLSIIPDEPAPVDGTGSVGGGYRTRKYGLLTFGDFFTSRQKLALVTLAARLRSSIDDDVKPGLALALGRSVDQLSSLVRWLQTIEAVGSTFGRQALPMVWDFCEIIPIGSRGANFGAAIEWVAKVVENSPLAKSGQVQLADATQHPLPDHSAAIWFTDPPYYDSVPYADLSDFFLVWLRRALAWQLLQDPFNPHNPLTPKAREAVRDEQSHLDGRPQKSGQWYEQAMHRAFAEGRRTLANDGLASVVFAHKTTEGWEALLTGMIAAGWTITSSWPIVTERSVRPRARESAALATSVHLVCRPRADDAGVGDWGAVLRELPPRVGDWMARLQIEGIRGADLVFACIGPALEIFSRYAKVETAEGREVLLPEYLEKVWEVVGRTALNQVLGFAEAKARNGAAAALEEDARLTALFLWALQATNGDATGAKADPTEPDSQPEEDEADDDEDAPAKKKGKGLSLIHDVVRRFAQPLGINLPAWEGRIIETEKGVVRLLPVAERAKQLFGKEGADVAAERIESGSRESPQLLLFPNDDEATPKRRGKGRSRRAGAVSDDSLKARREATTLDRVHAAMLLQAAGRANALRTLLADEQDRGPDFLRLANALSALYPKDSEEKRLLDAMLLAVPR